jgi:cytochrome c oxidase assembly protein subunit 16
MPVFSKKTYPSAAARNTIGARYRVALQKHPFLLFGLPFVLTIVSGSFFLTPATALRYERHDRKVRQVSKEEALGIGKGKRRVGVEEAAEEYYVSGRIFWASMEYFPGLTCCSVAVGSKRSGKLGAEACGETAWRARWNNVRALQHRPLISYWKLSC